MRMTVQRTQRATSNKRTTSKEKAKRGNMDIKHYENVKHEIHTRQCYIHNDRETMRLPHWNGQRRMPLGVYIGFNVTQPQTCPIISLRKQTI